MRTNLSTQVIEKIATENELIPELFEKVDKDFLQHLELTNNDRILFSGMFGIGKTTFLNYFFDQPEMQERYNVFHLYPVNYSVLSNDDIFKYIKYDILYEMLERKLLHNKSNLDFLKDEPSFVKNNLGNITALFLLLIPKMGKQLYQLKEEIQKLHKEFSKFKVKENEDDDEINKLINAYSKKDGELYEFNVTTKIIHTKLAELRNSKPESPKENILIIDDLDRIDPQHIFRLFNVFAAHFDTKNAKDKNKFGFDKIIFVCDVKNIKRIFAHSYGIDTDFNGYVDKFYSRKVYHFDNYQNIHNCLDIIFHQVVYNVSDLKYSKYLNEHNTFYADLIRIFRDLIHNQQINLRNLLKNFNKEIVLGHRRIYLQHEGSQEDERFPFLHFVRIIAHFFVDIDALIESIKFCVKNFNDEGVMEESNPWLLGEVIHFLKIIEEGKIPYGVKGIEFQSGDLKFDYSLFPNDVFPRQRHAVISKILNQDGQEVSPTSINYYDYFLKALQKLKAINYLR